MILKELINKSWYGSIGYINNNSDIELLGSYLLHNQLVLDEFEGHIFAFTYNEPLIWHEYIIDTVKLLKEKNVKTILVTNGYSTPEASEELVDIGIDAANIDIKAMSDDFYKKICGVPSVKPVLDTAKLFKSNGIHVEVTNLIIPDLNDRREDIKILCEWITENLGNNTPIHFSAYHPDFKMPSKKRTPYETLDTAYNIAKSTGISFVYVGNIAHEKGGNTYCPNCNYSLVIDSQRQKWYCYNCKRLY